MPPSPQQAAQEKAKPLDERWLGVSQVALELVGAIVLQRSSAWALRRRLAHLDYEVSKRQARAAMALVGSLAWYAGYSWESGRSHSIESKKRTKDATAMMLGKADDKTSTSTMKRTVVSEPE